MRGIGVHLWKEWREQRAVLLGIAGAIPVLTFATFLGFTTRTDALVGAGAIFVVGATVLAVLALSTELIAGESARGTLGFLRRQPGGLWQGLVAKLLLYLLGCGVATGLGAASLLGASRAIGGAKALEEAYGLLAKGGGPWIGSAIACVLGLWVLLASTWVPRGAAAAGLAILTLGALGFPGWILWGDDRAFLLYVGVSFRALVGGLAFVAASTLSFCFLAGLRFQRGTWSAAWRGLLVVACLGLSGYAYAARVHEAWSNVDPRDPEARLSVLGVGPDGRFAFCSLFRETESGGSGWRNIRVRLEDGTWEEVGPRGWSLHPTPGPWWDAAATASHEGYGLFLLHSSANPGSALGTEERLIDGVTGRALGSDSAAATPEGRERILASEERRLTPVRLSGGRRAWARGNRIQWESQAGPVAEFRLSNATAIEFRYPWGWVLREGTQRLALIAESLDATPVLTPLGKTGDYASFYFLASDGVRTVRRTYGKGKDGYQLVDANGRATPARGFEVSDQTITQEGGRVLVWSRGKAGAPGQALLVDLESGTRTPLAAEAGIPCDLVGVYSVGRLADGRHVLRGSSPAQGAGYLLFDITQSTLAHWTPTSTRWELPLLCQGADRILVVDQWRRIVRIHLGSGEREVLFPR